MYIAGTTTWGLLALAFSLVLDIESRVGKKPAFFEKNRASGFFWFLLAFFKKSRLLLSSFLQGFYNYIFDYLIR